MIDDSNRDFIVLMERVLAGDEDAAKTLLDQYGAVILHAVRRRLNQRLRSKFDSLDFVQDVWASFFANLPTEREFCQPKYLIAFLTNLARHKVIDVTRQRLGTEKYNVERECSLENVAANDPGLLDANQPTPSEVVTRREEWDQFLGTMPIVYRSILIALRDGKKPPEIADELGIRVRSVNRIISKLLSRQNA